MGQSWDATLYDDKHSFVWRQAGGLVELLAPQPGERILDLGSGTGHLTAQIAGAGAEVLGLDSSPAMIEQARQAHPALIFQLGDARELSFQGEFDAVFSNATLHWIPEADAVAKGVSRALKPGGRFVAEFGGKGNIQQIVLALRAAGQDVTGQELVDPWYFPSIATYAAVLERHGLEVTFATLFDRPTPLEGPDGMRGWIAMFGGPYVAQIDAGRRDAFVDKVLAMLRPTLCRDGAWHADYRRLRVLARKAATTRDLRG